jgi:hypothetical protein
MELTKRTVEHVDGAAAGLGHGAGVLEDARQHHFKVERRADGPADLA